MQNPVSLSYSLAIPLEFQASPGKLCIVLSYVAYVKANIVKTGPPADITIVSFNWITELLAAIDRQIEPTHHSPVRREDEPYKEPPIAFSLGNYVFGSECN